MLKASDVVVSHDFKDILLEQAETAGLLLAS